MHVGRDDTSRRVRKLRSLGVSNLARPSKCPEELRSFGRARTVAEIAPQHGSQRTAITAVAEKLEASAPETVRPWVRRAEIDAGKRPVVSTQEAEEPKRLKRENS
ncbi:putative transposase [Rhodococcus wratislaviensis NBRC 100605]|uniref:Putative transposase n=1 Tax=Rhodococcus wratislaviensis NBRC 100605 TaxID=1219028 RepID=X0Q0D7_RHOWR|nr:putative transposase [Rhodococcus wratislaviensis NBRC 100605]